MHTKQEGIDMEPNHSRISLIAALGNDTRVIGHNNGLIWHLKGDLPRFKALTNGHPIIMGRNTWLSLPGVLPGRTNIVLTSSDLHVPEGVLLARTLEEAFAIARAQEGSEEIFVIGGGKVYGAALPFADRLYLTLVQSDAEGDTYFPEYSHLFSTEVSREDHLEHDPPFAYVTLERA